MRDLAGVLLLMAAIPAAAADAAFTEDFRVAHERIASTYAYFDAKATRWPDIAKLYESDLAAVRGRRDFVRLMERVLDELYDPHAQLNTNLADSPRLVPSGTDLWAEWRDGRAVVTEVRRDSDASRAGICAGDQVIQTGGAPIAEAVERRMGRSYPHATREARDWALRSVVAGRHGTARELTLLRGGVERTVTLPAPDQFSRSMPAPAVTSSVISPGIGVITLNDSLGREDTIAAFDGALDKLRDSRALILDLRDTPGGGNTTVARAILGRFVDRERPYQKHVLPLEQRATGIWRGWLELVAPRGPFRFDKPVAVLVDHWTGSMGEGLAMGLDATIGARIMGTRMAGLLGATYTVKLPNTGLTINVPAERLYHVSGVPREAFTPSVILEVPCSASDSDPMLRAAIEALRQ